jgi:hypothetical protein
VGLRSVREGVIAWTLALLLAACGGDGGTGPAPTPPTITVQATAGGATVPLADGAAFSPPVRLDISTDRGTINATLNGATFFSGSAVSQPGAYTLAVTARDGAATTSESFDFTVAFAGSSLLTIRLLDLGANEEGGGGDAILLSDSAAGGVRHALVDAGPRGPGASDTLIVRNRMSQLGVQTLEAMILSHAHGDHFGAMGPVLRADSANAGVPRLTTIKSAPFVRKTTCVGVSNSEACSPARPSVAQRIAPVLALSATN